jgi:fatty-acyl-CoA synthase
MAELIKDWVDQNAQRRPDAVALAAVESGVEVTWAELERRVGQVARMLYERGIGRGDRIALLAENDPRIFETQFACMRIGAILVPLSWRLTRPELRQQLDDASARLLVHDTDHAATAADLGGDIPRLEWGEWGVPDSGYERAVAAAGQPVPGGELDPDAVTHVLYTSGTTGLPKGVLCTNRTLVTQAQNLAHTSGFARAGGHHLNIVPLFHAGGLNVFSNPMLFWGGRVTTVRRFDAEQTLRLLCDPELGVTHLCGVLQMYERITALPAFATATFPTLSTALFGGWGPSAAGIYAAWGERGIWVQLSYGASELGPNVSILSRPDPDAARRGTSGTVLPHTAVRLVDGDGTDVPQGETGEIWVRGPGVTPGYWRQPPDEFFTGEWFHTGDAAYLDETGQLYIVGRMKEMYRTGGENVYPAEVEAVLAQVPGVAEVAVLGVPDARWGETGLAAVVAEPGATVTLEDLRAFADGRLARFKLPTALIVLDELPRSATEKISRPRIREIWEKMAAGG